MLYLRADFVVRVKQHSELWCNRLLTTVKSRRARGEPSLLELSRVRRRKTKPTDDKPRAMSSLNIAEARRRKTKSNLTKKDAEERVKDHSFCFWAKCSNSRIQITGAKTHPPVCFDQWVCYLTNYQSNTICEDCEVIFLRLLVLPYRNLYLIQASGRCFRRTT